MPNRNGKPSILSLPNPGNAPGFRPAHAGRYAITAVDNPSSAAYTGLTIATGTDGVTRIYAANFRAGKIDVFDTSFRPVRSHDAFADANLPHEYSPFNVAAVKVAGITRIFVTYAIRDLAKMFGPGRGIVNTFHVDGSGRRRFAQHGHLNAPWGIMPARAGCGDLAGTVWIGNFGDGRIDAYDAATGAFVTRVRGVGGRAAVLNGLWTQMLLNTVAHSLSAA